MFGQDSVLAKENKGPVNTLSFLKPAFDRYNETQQDTMHLSDTIVYSNLIYLNAKDHPVPTRLLGPLKKFVTGVVMDFIDYKFLMTTVRYLSKSFLVFTQENCHYSSHMDRKAFIRVSLKEMLEGTVRIPMLNHPYYSNCTRLTLIYQAGEGPDSE